tara:strand:+ start:236 stop:1522 length:1287 start_codon:yes stop_codon:yes gene_type:complete
MYSSFPLVDHAKNLFPICRSLTGKGVRLTLDYFEKYHTEYERIIFKSGVKVFDWEIPKEWNIQNAYLEHIESGQRFAEFRKSNLHVVGYSVPIDSVLTLDELDSKIFTQTDQPEWVPYVTSYYKEFWGFCMSHADKISMPKGNYRAFIDSTLENGELHMSSALLSGSSEKEVFFSSYICHPSMANNELSGPVVLNAILDYIKQMYPERKYTYRFTLLPETIGSIAYLSRHSEGMKKNIICGFNLSCVGDDRAYSYVQTPYGDTLADKALSAALMMKDNVNVYSFLNRGSDERQYCSPGIELPLCTFCRSKFGEYPEYHTSEDNFSVVTEEGLQGSLSVLKDIIDAIETCLYPLLAFPCEPQLGKRGLYPNISTKTSGNLVSKRMDVLCFCNGKNSIFDISKFTKIELAEVVSELKILSDAGVVIESAN